MHFVAVLTLALLTASTADAQGRTFAARPFDSSQQLDDFHIAWYSRHLDKDDTQILLATLVRKKFWGAPTNETGPGGFDRAQWIIEGVKHGKYHVIDREGGGEFKGWTLLLMRQSGEDLQLIY